MGTINSLNDVPLAMLNLTSTRQVCSCWLTVPETCGQAAKGPE